jgi:hypothetical protein
MYAPCTTTAHVNTLVACYKTHVHMLNSHKQFLNELGASYVGVCSKLVLISMVVAVICNNNKLANELV